MRTRRMASLAHSSGFSLFEETSSLPMFVELNSADVGYACFTEVLNRDENPSEDDANSR